MTQFSFGYRIEAKDATRSTLASALSGVTRFARLASKPITIPLRVGRRGLSLLRDINLGLRPLVGAIDNVIDRGARLEVVSKSFQSLTGKNAAQARRLAKELVVAASGTIKLSKAMEIANRALGSGIDISQLTTAIEFISKKAITTGKNAEQSLEKVITGLSRGSTLFLDDFGILVDGIDGVRRAFDKVKGAGAFDSLGPAAQKAETIRQAIAEMSVQMGKIGVTGKETIFLFQGIKNAIGDSVEKLVGAVAKSKSLKNVLKDTRDVLSGISEFFDSGGSFVDLLFGGKGKSNGLLDVLESASLDIAETFGRGILGGLLKAISLVPDLFDGIGNTISGFLDSAFIDKIPGAISSGLNFLITDFIPALQKALTEPFAKFLVFLSDTIPGFSALTGILPSPSGQEGKPGLLERIGLYGANLVRGPLTSFSRFFGITRPEEGPQASAANGTIGGSLPVALAGLLPGLVLGATPPAANNKGPITKLPPGQDPVEAFKAKRGLDDADIKTIDKFTRKGLDRVDPAFYKDTSGTLNKINDSGASSRRAIVELERAREERARLLKLANASRSKQPPKTGTSRPTAPQPIAPQPTLRDIAKLAGDAADKVLGGGILGNKASRTRGAVDRFTKRLSPSEPEPKPLTLDLIPATLTDRGRRIQKRKLNLLNRELRGIKRETGVITRQANRDSRRLGGEEVRKQRGLGFKVDRRQLERQIFEWLVRERTAKQRERIGDINKEIASTVTRKPQETTAPVPTALKEIVSANKDTVDRIESAIEKLTESMNAGVAALVGEERMIANAGGRRT